MEGIISDTVVADWQPRRVEVKFVSQHGHQAGAKPSEATGPRREHSVTLDLAGQIEPDGCYFNVADRNMMMVLKKAEPVGTWPALEAAGISATEAPRYSKADEPPLQPGDLAVPRAADERKKAPAQKAPAQKAPAPAPAPAAGALQDKLLYELD